ncbi:MAG: hypothetical protein CR984_05725 [Proteobacteria bacterium]|nr:MAG: hypothetical protein CR984_05725 [Pseudomonadota bacterium]PIE67298.1 MAG: hypothetical protein CSA23_04885 [Deltaproteobacteria bacterium]
MIGIVFATRQEAEPFLSLASVVSVKAAPFPFFRVSPAIHPECVAVVSGMGKIAAALAAAEMVLRQGCKVLVSAGLCGCLSREKRWHVGDLLRVGSAVEGDCERFGEPDPEYACSPQWFEGLETARLVTCDRPVFTDVLRQTLLAIGDLADMEGVAVARTAHCYGIPCAMLKGISDGADETGRKHIARHIARVSERIARKMIQELTSQATDTRS